MEVGVGAGSSGALSVTRKGLLQDDRAAHRPMPQAITRGRSFYASPRSGPAARQSWTCS